jgi:hypothetical protein
MDKLLYFTPETVDLPPQSRCCVALAQFLGHSCWSITQSVPPTCTLALSKYCSLSLVLNSITPSLSQLYASLGFSFQQWRKSRLNMQIQQFMLEMGSSQSCQDDTVVMRMTRDFCCTMVAMVLSVGGSKSIVLRIAMIACDRSYSDVNSCYALEHGSSSGRQGRKRDGKVLFIPDGRG